jgi:hypothetical protein
MRAIGWSDGNTDGEEGEQRRNEIRPGVHGLRHETEAVRLEPCRELDRDEQAGGAHGDERRSPLWRHDKSLRLGGGRF